MRRLIGELARTVTSLIGCVVRPVLSVATPSRPAPVDPEPASHPEELRPMAEIQLPQLGESVTEGTITKWFKQVGETVAEDEVLFEVSTDKVDSEVPSPVAGVLTEIRVPEGDTVDVGTVIAVVGDGDAAPAAAPAPAAEPAPAPAEPAPPEPAPAAGARAPAPAPAPAPAAAPAPRRPPAPAPAPRRPRRPTTRRASSCRRSCASWSTTTASTRPPSPAPGRAGASPAPTSSRPSGPAWPSAPARRPGTGAGSRCRPLRRRPGARRRRRAPPSRPPPRAAAPATPSRR